MVKSYRVKSKSTGSYFGKFRTLVAAKAACDLANSQQKDAASDWFPQPPEDQQQLVVKPVAKGPLHERVGLVEYLQQAQVYLGLARLASRESGELDLAEVLGEIKDKLQVLQELTHNNTAIPDLSEISFGEIREGPRTGPYDGPVFVREQVVQEPTVVGG